MIAVILNHHARGVHKHPDLAVELAKLLGDQGKVYETHSIAELEHHMAQIHLTEMDILAICGGDGTNRATLTALLRAPNRKALPKLALLPGGTINTVCRNLGISGTPQENLRRLVECISSGQALDQTEVDLLQVGSQFGFVFGAAMAARFFQVYYAGTPGLLRATMLALRTILSGLVRGPFSKALFTPVRANLSIDGEPLEKASLTLLAAATLPEVGLGLHPTYRARSQPGSFQLLASGLPPFALVRQLGKVLRGKPLSGQPHLDVLARHAEVEFTKEEPYILDGDFFLAESLALACGPRLTVLRP